jgi:hypothetical protein
MATIKLVSQFTVDLGGEFKSDGDLVTELELTAADGDFVDIKKTITNSSGDNFNLVTLWTASASSLADFDFLWFKADAACLLSLISGSEHTSLNVAANIPYILSTDDVENTALTDNSLETFSQIDQIKVMNNTTGAVTTNSVNCRLVLIT